METEMLEDTTTQYFTVARYIDRKDGSVPWLWIDHSTSGRMQSEQQAVSEASRLTEQSLSSSPNPYFAIRITDIKMVEKVDGK